MSCLAALRSPELTLKFLYALEYLPGQIYLGSFAVRRPHHNAILGLGVVNVPAFVKSGPILLLRFRPAGATGRNRKKGRAGRLAPVRLADRRVFIYILKDVLRFGQIRYAHSPIALERKHGKLALAYYFYATQLSICPTDELAERIPYVLHTATSSLTEHDVMFDHIASRLEKSKFCLVRQWCSADCRSWGALRDGWVMHRHR